jgi:hypothetical protein
LQLPSDAVIGAVTVYVTTDFVDDVRTRKPFGYGLEETPPPVGRDLGAAASGLELAGIGADHGQAADVRRIQRENAVVA